MAEGLLKNQLHGDTAMRSIVLALAFAAPLSAVAATPNTFTRPSYMHDAKPQQVMMTFINRSSQDREVVVGGMSCKLHLFEKASFEVPVGSDVRVYSQTNSKINGQVLMQVSASDQNTDVVLH
jgi:hypothetical protein